MSKFNKGDIVKVLGGHRNNGHKTVVTHVENRLGFEKVHFNMHHSLKNLFSRADDWYSAAGFELVHSGLVKGEDYRLESPQKGSYTFVGMVDDIAVFTDKDGAIFAWYVDYLNFSYDVKEFTVAEIAVKLGLDPSELRIKD